MFSSGLQWILVSVGMYALPVALTIAVLLLRRPRNRGLRAFLGVAIAWLSSVLFTAEIYNPVGEAYTAAAFGAEYAFNRFDNNTVAVMILAGWIPPVLTVIIFFGSAWTWRRLRGSANVV